MIGSYKKIIHFFLNLKCTLIVFFERTKRRQTQKTFLEKKCTFTHIHTYGFAVKVGLTPKITVRNPLLLFPPETPFVSLPVLPHYLHHSSIYSTGLMKPFQPCSTCRTHFLVDTSLSCRHASPGPFAQIHREFS